MSLYTPLVYEWCRKAGLSATDSADVGQEVYKSVVDRIGEFVHSGRVGAFRAWLKTITRSRIADHFRRQIAAMRASGGSAALQQLREVPAPDEIETDSSIAQEESQLLARALELIRVDFKETTWQAFWSVVVQGRPPADVAEELGITLNAVYLAKARVARRLKSEFKGIIPLD